MPRLVVSTKGVPASAHELGDAGTPCERHFETSGQSASPGSAFIGKLLATHFAVTAVLKVNRADSAK